MELSPKPLLGFLPPRGPGAAYAAASGVANLGAAFGLLGATGLATVAGGADHGAMAVGVLVALFQLSAALAVPYATSICRGRSVRIVFARVQAAAAGVWFCAGVALLLGAPSLPVLLVAAVPAGATNGLLAVFRPTLAKSYFGAEHTSAAVATMTLVFGVTWGVGALLGGLLLSSVDLAWGLVVFAGCALVLAGALQRVRPSVEAAAPPADARPWHTAWAGLKDNHVVRWSAVLGVTGALFITPIGGLVVPIAQAFRPDRPVSGASLLMASISVGQLCSPWGVRRFSAHRPELSAGAFSTALCGGSLVTLAIVSALLAPLFGELAVWLVVGVVFGATRFAAGALYFGAAADSGRDEEASRNLAAVTLSSLLAAPLGVLACSAVLGSTSAYIAVVLSGAGAAVVGSFVLAASRRAAVGA